MLNATITVLDQKKAKCPEVRVIVLDDSFNIFQHIVNSLMKIIGGMSKKRHGI